MTLTPDAQEYTTTAAQDYAELYKQHRRFVSKVHFKRERFFNFMLANPSLAVFDDVAFNVTDTETNPKSYSMSLSMAPWEQELLMGVDGVYFSAESESDEGRNFFVLPFAYIENPAGWEKTALNTLAHYQSMVEDAYYTMAPHQRDNAEVSVRIQRVNDLDNSVSAIVVRGDNTGLIIGDPNKAELVTNSFSVDRDNGAVRYHSLV